MGGLHGCRRMTHVCSSRTLRRWLGGADGSLSADSPETDDTALPPPSPQEPCEWTAERACDGGFRADPHAGGARSFLDLLLTECQRITMSAGRVLVAGTEEPLAPLWTGGFLQWNKSPR